MGLYILDGLEILFKLFYYAMFFYIISSWFPALKENFLGRFIGRIVEPYLSLFRKYIPPIGMIDISAIVAIFAYGYLTRYALEGLRVVLSYMNLI